MSFLYQALTSEEIAEIRAADAAEKAYDDGKKVGIDQGILKERKKIAAKLYTEGKSIEEIAEWIEISVDEAKLLLKK